MALPEDSGRFEDQEQGTEIKRGVAESLWDS